MSKSLLKLLEYIFPSNKQWTGVWFLRYRDLAFPSIGGENTGVVLTDKICTIIAKLFIHLRKTYKKGAASDEYILGVRKERTLSLAIVSESREKMV